MQPFFFGFLLGFSDWIHRFLGRSREFIRSSDILIVGLFQALALIPGTSRSGITIAAGLFGNLNHTAATRFSFLLGAPIIFAAGMHKLIAFISQPNALQDYTHLHLIVGLGVSFLVGLLAIRLLLKVVEKFGLLPFIVYRVILAVAILIYYHG